MPDKIKVSVVSYLNSQVFIHGLEHSDISSDIILYKDIPSVCAQRLIHSEADIGLVPVAVIPQLQNFRIITDTCIGAKGRVNSVMLYSEIPIDEIEEIILDYHSRTSVILVQVLAKNYWKIAPRFIPASENFIELIKGKTAAVIIGDRTFAIGKKYGYTYDLAEAWTNFTNLPFVFACWVANKNVSDDFINKFSHSLQFGLQHKSQIINRFSYLNNDSFDVKDYLENNIQYYFDEEKKRGLDLFFSYSKQSISFQK